MLTCEYAPCFLAQEFSSSQADFDCDRISREHMLRCKQSIAGSDAWYISSREGYHRGHATFYQ